MSFVIFDFTTPQVITSNMATSDISDDKKIVLPEIDVPGLNYKPTGIVSCGNNFLKFSIPVYDNNEDIGNIALMNQYKMLRTLSFNIVEIFSPSQFRMNPKVLFYHGTTTPFPLEFFVVACDFLHKGTMINGFGNPKHSTVNMMLMLDQTSIIYRAEELSRIVLASIGMVQSVDSLF